MISDSPLLTLQKYEGVRPGRILVFEFPARKGLNLLKDLYTFIFEGGNKFSRLVLNHNQPVYIIL